MRRGSPRPLGLALSGGCETTSLPSTVPQSHHPISPTLWTHLGANPDYSSRGLDSSQRHSRRGKPLGFWTATGQLSMPRMHHGLLQTTQILIMSYLNCHPRASLLQPTCRSPHGEAWRAPGCALSCQPRCSPMIPLGARPPNTLCGAKSSPWAG